MQLWADQIRLDSNSQRQGDLDEGNSTYENAVNCIEFAKALG